MSQEKKYETERYDAGQVREAAERRQSRKRQLTPAERRRRKWLGRIRRFILWVIFVGVSSVLLAGVGWLLANDLCAFNKEPLTATVTVTKDDDLGTVADKLKESGLIEYKWFFKLFGKVSHAEGKIGIGSYELNTEMDYNALINGMRNRNAALNAETVRISFREGLTVRQVIALMAEYGVNTEEALLDAAANYDFSYAFLDPALKGDVRRLEGYLFPDTYEFYVNGTPAIALDKLLGTFDAKIDEELGEQIENSGYTLREIVTIASLIEKETDGKDQGRIASVIYNRLNNVGETYHLLQIDASQIYGLGDRYNGKLTQTELEIDTPYNTHLHEGLPPTPIANPGLTAIKAAVSPEQTNYFFYALGADGRHHFFRTYAEHLSFVNNAQYGG